MSKKNVTLQGSNKQQHQTMARPIRNTPVLYGEDAERFLADISQLPPVEERRSERARIEKSVDDFMELVAAFKATKKDGASEPVYTH